MTHNTIPDSPIEHRYAILAPYLRRMRGEDGAGAIVADPMLDHWEKTVLERAASEHGSDGARWPALVVEGVALQSKYRNDLRQLETSDSIPPETLNTVQAQLMTDAALGLALMEETQRAVDLMVLAGKIDEAKKLTGFRNKLLHTVAHIKNTISPVAYEAAEALSTRMIPAAGENLRASPSSDGDDAAALIKKPKSKVTAPAPTRTDRPRDHTRLLIAVLAALVVVWAVLVLPGLGVDALPIVTEQQMPQSDAIRELMARPPSLFIEVDSGSWRSMSAADRRQLVKEVGAIAEASGYTGVQFRDSDGSSVAQWLRTQGVWLADAATHPEP